MTGRRYFNKMSSAKGLADPGLVMCARVCPRSHSIWSPVDIFRNVNAEFIMSSYGKQPLKTFAPSMDDSISLPLEGIAGFLVMFALRFLAPCLRIALESLRRT